MGVNREQARAYLTENAKGFLTPDKSGKGFICPICGSGSGAKGTGITTKDGVHFTCWAGCFTNSDFIDVVGMKNGLTEYSEKLEAACKEAGITLDGNSSYRGAAGSASSAATESRESPGGTKAPQRDPSEQQAAQIADYTEYYTLCHSRIGETDYPQRRGLSSAILERFKIGFDPAWKHPKTIAEGKNPPATPRLIIPTSENSYLARDTRSDVPENQRDYVKSKVGKVHIFNLDALEDAEKPCFIVEGEIDALSIIEVGGNALAIGSTSNAGKLLKALDGIELKQPLIIALDGDEAGQKAENRLAEELQRRGIHFYRRNPCGKYKDANEALQKDRESLRAAVEAANGAGEEEKQDYLGTSAGAHLQSFLDGITDSVNTPCISTGFTNLDNELDGGFYEGLYIIGAISSLGKTTFSVQMCDQIAAAGHDVLIFSLEMARTQLMSKSISRHTFKIAHELYKSQKDVTKANRLAKTGRGITDGRRYLNYSREEVAVIRSAVNAYEEYAGRIFVHEGIGNIGATQIRETIERHKRITGNTPFVLIDYLQILAPYNERYSDKQNTDKAVLELKRISRDYKTTVLAISSLNRMSYKDKIDMTAFKESGAIEYTSDVLIGMQAEGAGERNFDPNVEKRKNPRKIEVVILKNREAATGGTIKFDYYTLFNLFEET